MKETGVYERKLIPHLSRGQASRSVFSALKHLKIWKSPRDFIRKMSTCLSYCIPAVSTVSDTKQWWNKPCLWMERRIQFPQTLPPALWMRDPSFKWRQREDTHDGPKGGQHGLALDAWEWGCHTGLQAEPGRLRGLTQKWSFYGIMREHSLLFSATWSWTSQFCSKLSFTHTEGLVKIPRKRMQQHPPPHTHFCPFQLIVEHVPLSPHIACW